MKLREVVEVLLRCRLGVGDGEKRGFEMMLVFKFERLGVVW